MANTLEDDTRWNNAEFTDSEACTEVVNYYENMPIQIYWKFNHQKWKFSDKNYIFLISA